LNNTGSELRRPLKILVLVRNSLLEFVTKHRYDENLRVIYTIIKLIAKNPDKNNTQLKHC
jgi:hypothetical protein